MKYARASMHWWRGAVVLAMGLAAVAISAGQATVGLLPTTPTSTWPLAVISSQVLDLGDVFGNVVPPEICGRKFEDLNGNGVREPGEPPLAGVTIRLTGTDGLGNPVSLVTVTDANGVFCFRGLLPGTYVVSEVLAAGRVLSLRAGSCPAGTYLSNTGICRRP